MADLPDNFINSASEQYVESSYRFTQPIRYFKSNDPYYWEVDNIPIKQLEENILFLKDQIANNLNVSGIGREDLAELRPSCTGSDRVVYVNPGRYTARINDAYRKGINRFNEIQAIDYKAFDAEGESSPVSARRQAAFTLTADVLKQIAGEVVTPALLDNGLFHFLQHHNSEALTDASLKYSFGRDQTINPGNGIDALPKIKMAVWRAYSPDFGTEAFRSDLQQESVEFTRHWGGAIRTSVVNVAEPLSIDIPEFDENDFANATTSQPTTRIDLLFVYSHPMDASSTSIVKPNGAVPTTITAPTLGLLQGAGVIALSQGQGNFNTFQPNQSGFFDDTTFSQGSSVASNYFESSDSIGANGNHRTVGSLADQFQSSVGIDGEYASLPSPDDLLNLTPLFEQTLSEDSLALVGQSILPIAYIVVERGKPNIEQNSVFDIRPFFRTTELSYNERAGIAAANPPLSFANPAVGKKEFQKSLLDVRDHIITVSQQALTSRPIAAGTIWGGTKWGPEGPILGAIKTTFGAGGQNNIDGNSQAVAEALKNYGSANVNLTQAPVYPGWDINHDYFDDDSDNGAAGTLRNDRLHSFVRYGGHYAGAAVHSTGNGRYFYDYNNTEWYDPVSAPGVNKEGLVVGEFGYGGPIVAKNVNASNGAIFVKKYISINPELLQDFDDYEVNLRMVNSCTRAGLFNAESGGNANMWQGVGNTGFFYEKHGKSGFTIYVICGPAQTHQGSLYFMKPDTPDASYNVYGISGQKIRYWIRESSKFSMVRVMNKYHMDFGPTDLGTTKSAEQGGSLYRACTRTGDTFVPIAVTYPTVSFEVVGYSGGTGLNNYYSTDAATDSPNTLTGGQ